MHASPDLSTSDAAHPSGPDERSKDDRAERRRDAGYVLALTALLMTGLLGATALAVDLGAWFARAATIQRTADAASLAAVTYMPSESRVNQEVATVLARNGFVDGQDGIEVNVELIGNTRVNVDIRDTDADQFFSGIFTDKVEVEREATAEFIKPVPMGSPRNYVGTGDLFGGAGEPPADDFWISVSGYCARREHGDRLTPANDSQGRNDAWGGCGATGQATTGRQGVNPEYRANGYFYAIELDDGDPNTDTWPYNPVVEVFDAAHCQFEGTGAADSGAAQAAQREYTFTVRDNNSPLDPSNADPLQTTTVSPSDCGTYADAWVSMGSLPAASSEGEGIYYLQIDPVTPTDKSLQEGQNQLAIRVRDPGWSTSDSEWPCTSDPTTVGPNVEQDDYCPRVYGLTHLGAYVDKSDNVASPYLAEVGQEHAGKTMVIELFDPAEGMRSIEILDPLGNPVTFDWEIGCQDGTYVSESGPCNDFANPPAPNSPDAGRGPFLNRTAIDVRGTVDRPNRPYGARMSQNGRFSDRLIRITFDLPTVGDNPTWYNGNSWFRIRYTAGGGDVGDRTTWSVQILGDPVRLVG